MQSYKARYSCKDFISFEVPTCNGSTEKANRCALNQCLSFRVDDTNVGYQPRYMLNKRLRDGPHGPVINVLDVHLLTLIF